MTALSRVTYLDNAATSWPKPASVPEAITAFLVEEAANPGRGAHRMAVATERRMERLRHRLAELVNAESDERMLITLNCTDGLNLAIRGAVGAAEREGTSRGDPVRVVTSVLEHNSVVRPLNWLERSGRVEVARVDCEPDSTLDPDRVLEHVDERTVLVALQHASNVTGAIHDVARIGSLLREHYPDALFLVDGAATVGLVPVDVVAMQIDLLAFPGHKSLLGPTGTGGLYVGPRAYDPRSGIARIEPLRHGGTGGDSTAPLMPEELPHFLEGGTPNTVGCAGLLAALEGYDGGMLEHERRLVGRMMQRYADDQRVRITGPALEQRTGILSLVVAGWDPMELGALLDERFAIAVRPGLHCAPACHDAIGTFPQGTLRVSPGPYTTDDEIDRFLETMDRVIGA